MTDFTEIPELVNAYYLGMYTGDGELLRQVFDPSARVRGFFADRFLDSDLDAFLAAMTSGESPMQLGQPQSVEIVHSRADEDVATVVVRDTLHGVTFIDHLALMRRSGAWKVMHKAYFTPSQLPARR
ncbi:MAG: nuclear transport factor 2 family protein [Pseudomonadota bacterium]|uniref:nuclear transport factor 2 family protein n=1 Tax=Phenylobacterium sp. TaxID=1871053 RepID=UPI0025D56DC6|nr:nuclear transport factor 2 family protein [Phenylobacterium sp.]MBT9471133.1 nuclear transport factor 2 family protein [Phenylobacterium sp.]